MDNSQIADSIMQLFEKHGQLEYGEHVTQVSHAVQAGLIARDWGYDDELVLAAFLHDIGHLVPLEQEEAAYQTMGNFGMEQHDKWGEDFLQRAGFSSRLIATVRNHVDAKRYLCFADADYYALLSDASKQTLGYQGGPMSEAEAALFETEEFFQDSIRIRKVDEEAKSTDFAVMPEHLSFFQGLLHQHLATNRQA